MENYILGVNYWASNAGADMWRNWSEEAVRKDLASLASYGVEVLRVFPNWRDFQPVEPVFGGGHQLREYRMTGDGYPENPYYLNPLMLERFERFCQIAEEHGMKLIVGLITGWMSGRLFVPPALFEKNIFTDPTALYFQQLFIKGFVTRLKNQPCISAWDLGNECNCMDQVASREEAYSWSSVIVNAIKACDHTRPVVSGMHSLEVEGVWNIQDQGEITDVLTTHPYPFWVEHCKIAPLTDFRILLHATAQTQYYATVGKKPCLVEELGSMGPMICSEEGAAGFLKANLWSNWAHGAVGLLWWCANDQTLLTAPPYEWNMCERELGMLDVKGQPKPSLLAMKAFSDEMKRLQLELPYRETDGVCILTKGQDHWGIAYMSYVLAKQAGLTLDFAYCDQELPDSRLYFLPSAAMAVMNKKNYDLLKEKVYAGAVLYISNKDGIFTEFEELTGFRVEHSRESATQGTARWNGLEIPYRKSCQLELTAARAEVLAEDERGNPLFGQTAYGAGRVYFLSVPVEEMLLTDERGFDQAYYQFYAAVAKEVLEEKAVQKTNPFVGITLHKGGDAEYAVLVNYTGQVQEPGIVISDGLYKAEALYGQMDQLEPFGAVVLKLEKEGTVYED